MSQFDDIPDKDYPYSGKHSLNAVPRYKVLALETITIVTPIAGTTCTATLSPTEWIIPEEYLYDKTNSYRRK